MGDGGSVKEFDGDVNPVPGGVPTIVRDGSGGDGAVVSSCSDLGVGKGSG